MSEADGITATEYFYMEEDTDILQCPHCGSHRVVSRRGWLHCEECGKKWKPQKP